MPNIAYRTPEIARYYGSNRMRWDQFYPSERWVLERLYGAEKGIGRVLDVGCAVGGLGSALQERFELSSYTGVDINAQAVEAARERREGFRCPVQFHLGDVATMKEIEGDPFALVAALGCADYNIETTAILEACWNHVARGGRLLLSLRLTHLPSINDLAKSHQRIRQDGDPDFKDDDERANYVVFNVRDALKLFHSLEPRPSHLLGYGYWGAPSKTAVTPYDRLVFTVFAITKSESAGETSSELHLPLSLWTS